VLLLPATRRDGEALCVVLAREAVDCLVCQSAAQVVTEMERGAATLVLTDSALTGTGGRRIIEALLLQPQWSDLPVVLLGRVETSPEAAELIGKMTNVTVLERPTSSRTLLSAIHACVRARLRQYQMRDQLTALREAENALRLTDRRKDEFLAMLAHELRNPLAPMLTASDLLPRLVPAGNERVDSTLRVMNRQVRQLSRLVDDLLDVSRITQGRVELQLEVIDLESVVAQALESVEPMIKEKQHTVLSHSEDAVFHVRGDRARLVQCVSNILTNAAKYTDTGGEIHINLQRRERSAVISVRDNGVGISPELLATIFDLFVQSERSLDRAQGGLGIGLSVVRQLVGMHHGTVIARSAGIGRGSTFEIRLPLVDTPLSDTPEAMQGEMARKRVLVVDDNRDAADSISMLLQTHGHDVRTAYEGEAALSVAASFPADLVLLDIGLPGMNGYEVARQLRSRNAAVQLVALTGYGQPDDVKRAMEAGFDAHLVKPVDFGRVLQALG
jgi:signal transduction histidine kinase